MSFLLESIEGGSARGRYSVIGFAPDVIWQAVGETASINRTPMADAGAFVPDDAPTLQSLRNFLAESAIVLPEALPPMAAGIFGFMGYDTVRLIEKLPEMTAGYVRRAGRDPDPSDVDADLRQCERRNDPGDAGASERRINAADAYAAALARIHGAMQSLDAPLPHGSSATTKSLSLPEPQSNTTAADYLAMVAKAKDYIKAGDIFQVVLSQRFSAPSNCHRLRSTGR